MRKLHEGPWCPNHRYQGDDRTSTSGRCHPWRLGGARASVVCTAALLALLSGSALGAQRSAAVYHDQASGLKVTAPAGWRRTADGEFASPAGARAAFTNRDESVIVFVIVEFIPGGIVAQTSGATARYLDMVVKRPSDGPAPSTPRDVVFAGRPGLRTTKSISNAKASLVNVVSVTQEGYHYFMLSSIALTSDRKACERAQGEFERAAVVTKSSEDVLAELGAAISEEFPFLDAEAATEFVRIGFARMDRMDSAAAVQLGYRSRARGRARLAPAERVELEAIEQRQFATLPASIQLEHLALLEKVDKGIPLNAQERQRAREIIVAMTSGTDGADLVRYRQLTLKSLKLGFVE